MSQAEQHPITLRLKDATAVSGLCRDKIYELIAEGKLASVKVGKLRLIRRDSLEQLLTPAEAA